MPPDLHSLLADLRAEHEDLAGLVDGADLDGATPATGWDIRDAVSHLRGTDREAFRAVTDPEGFLAALPVIAQDVEGFLTGQLREGRALGADLLVDWHTSFDLLVKALAVVSPATRIPWYGPPMSPASFATARIMEYWAHGQDVADGLGTSRAPTDRLRHVAHLGVRTRGFSYAVRGLPAPDGDVRVVLSAPGGQPWEWGAGEQEVRGTALDFCLLVTQRRHRADLALVATGALADEWLDVAQAYAGPPGPGRGRVAGPA